MTSHKSFGRQILLHKNRTDCELKGRILMEKTTWDTLIISLIKHRRSLRAVFAEVFAVVMFCYWFCVYHMIYEKSCKLCYGLLGQRHRLKNWNLMDSDGKWPFYMCFKNVPACLLICWTAKSSGTQAGYWKIVSFLCCIVRCFGWGNTKMKCCT